MSIMAIGADGSILPPTGQSLLMHTIKLGFVLVCVAKPAANVVRQLVIPQIGVVLWRMRIALMLRVTISAYQTVLPMHRPYKALFIEGQAKHLAGRQCEVEII